MPIQNIILINKIFYVLIYFSAVLKISLDDLKFNLQKKTALLRFLTFQLLFQQKNEENNINKLNSTLKPHDNY